MSLSECSDSALSTGNAADECVSFAQSCNKIDVWTGQRSLLRTSTMAVFGKLACSKEMQRQNQRAADVARDKKENMERDAENEAVEWKATMLKKAQDERREALKKGLRTHPQIKLLD